jgi:hypothetical protein
VYEVRPAPCRGWECGWKLLPNIPDGWRPAESGIVLRIEGDLTITILDTTKLFLTPEFANFVCSVVEAGSDVFFQAVGPAGHFPSKALVNPHIRVAMQQQDLGMLQQAFLEIFFHISVAFNWQLDGLVLRNDVDRSTLGAAS